MDRIQQVAMGFRIAGMVTGIPSLCAALFFGFSWFQLRTPVVVSPAFPGESQSLITLLMGSLRFLGKVAGFLNDLSRAILAGLFVAAVVLTLVCVMVYLTGRGIAAHQAWARMSGMAITVVVMGCWLIGLMPMRWGPPSLALTAVSGYAFWVLLRFAA